MCDRRIARTLNEYRQNCQGGVLIEASTGIYFSSVERLALRQFGVGQLFDERDQCRVIQVAVAH